MWKERKIRNKNPNRIYEDGNGDLPDKIFKFTGFFILSISKILTKSPPMVEFAIVGGIQVHIFNSQQWKRNFCAVLAVFIAMISVYSPAAYDMAGRTITVFDGKNKKVIQARGNTFDEVLAEAGIAIGKYDVYWATTEKPEADSIIVIERAVPVTISEGGKTRTLYTVQQTVQGAVNDAGYDWQTMMPVEDGLGKIKKGMTIHVVPYEKRTVVRKETIPVNYVKWYDESLGAGEETILDQGRPEIRELSVEEYVSNGKVIRSDVVKTTVMDAGASGTALVGTMEDTVGRVLRMKATAYHPTDGDGRGITATGTKAGHGTVAVDPSVIPLGSDVYISGYGNAVAADTGGAIVGNRIDLCMETFSECYDFGVRSVDVFVSHN